MKPLEFKKLSLAEARGDADRDPAKVEECKQAVERTAHASAVLLDETSRWLGSLPANVRPLACARMFPRIVNSIADVWRRVRQCEEYLDSLMIDERGSRAGFPLDVAKELLALRSYYADLHPKRDHAWELVARDE
jgi:hypothetical protein